MIQPQIAAYAKTQLGLGMSEEVIRNALVEAGWTVQDVEDSIKSVAQEKQPDVMSPVSSATPSSRPSTQSHGFSSQPINLKDLFRGAGEGGDSLVAAADSSKTEASKTETQAIESVYSKADTSALSASKSGNISKIVEIAVAVIALASTAAAVFLYVSNKKLADQVTALAAAQSATSGLTTQLTDLTASKLSAERQLADALKEADQLRSELSFFVLPAGSPQESAFSLSGVLTMDDKQQYSVTASSGLEVFIKNSKIQQIDAVLRPLVGQNIEISGTHAQFSMDVTVSVVNGVSL